MAKLQQSDGPAWWFVPARCLLGRSRACAIRLDSPDVSGEHALLRWTGSAWELQDLHSRNGTFVDGQRLDPTQRVRLLPGAELGFGCPEGYVLIEITPPQPHAVQLGVEHSAIAGQEGLLVLPDLAEPELTVYRRGRGWLLESDGDTREVEDGEVVQTRAGRWRLYLPERLSETHDREGGGPAVAALSLHFSVHPNEEYIELLAHHGERTIDLKARAHHHLLLQLARARLADRDLPDGQQGWIHQDELLRQLRCEPGLLNLNIHRIRRQFAEAGIADAGQIIERRPGTRQLRIGVSNIAIEPLQRRLTQEN